MKLDLGKKRNACIVGVGRSIISRDSGKRDITLAVDACIEAIKDAGLTKDEIDGIVAPTTDNEGVNGHKLQEAMRLKEVNWYGSPEGIAGLAIGTVMVAAKAVEYGVCNYCVVVSGGMKPKGSGSMRNPFAGVSGPPQVHGDAQWTAPFGGIGYPFMQWMSRYMWKYNAPRETFGHIAVTERYHASLNPRAIARAPLTMEDYLSSRWISEPQCLYDCDILVDGYAAVVVTTPDRARHLRNRPVQLVCGSKKTGPRPDYIQWDDLSYMGTKFCCENLWELSGNLSIKDVDVACFHDGFTILTVNWIESLGFCGPGEAKDYLKGDMMRLGGSGVPLNPHGGMLSEGALGMGLAAEAADQLMGRCGPRQVPNARVAAVANGGGPRCEVMLFQALD